MELKSIKKKFDRFLLIVTFLCIFSGYLQAQEPAQCEHDWGFPTWTCADDYSAATAHFTCALCGATEDVDGIFEDFGLADGHKAYWAEINKNDFYQVFGPNVLHPGINQILQTHHPYYIFLPVSPHSAYRIWTKEKKSIKFYMLNNDDGTIDYSINGEAIYISYTSKDRQDFDGNLDFFIGDGSLYGIVFLSDDAPESMTVNVKGVIAHTYTIRDAIVGGTVTATPRHSGSLCAERSKAYEDDILWLDPTPEEGFELQSMTVTDAKGRDVEILEHDGRRYIVMPEVAVTINAQFRPTTWTALQTTLNNASTDANNPTVITLANDITATGGDAYLDLPYGHHVILDLNGHTIDRALNEGTDNGYVLKVNNNSTLTIRDSAGGGTITGGWNTNGPGCITVYSSATLRLESGTISGNRVNIQGGSAISSSGTVYITDGTITDNWSNITCYNSNMCGTFYFSGGGTLYMSGGTISGNRCGSTTYGAAGIGVYLGMGSPNIHLSGTYNISGNMQGVYDEQTGEWSNLTPSDVLNTDRTTYHIDDPISPTAPAAMILYTYGNKTTFTNGWSTYMNGEDPEDYFTLANPNGQGIGLNSSGEATIGTLHTVTLADGLTASATQAAPGRPITLSTETGYILSSVTVNGTPATDNGDGTWSFIMPAQDVTVAATVSMPPVTYIDADGTEQSCTYYTLLTSDDDISNAMVQGYLPGGWYVVDGAIDCLNLRFSGDVHIILADGASFCVQYGIDSEYDLTIYGQAAGSGKLSVDINCNNICINGGIINNQDGIQAKGNVTVNGGIINYNGNYGIQADGNVTINGGIINKYNGTHGIQAKGNVTINGGIINNNVDYGIQAKGNVTINGGIINYNGACGILADGNVTINGGTLSFNSNSVIWASNVILASSTSLKTLNITNGIGVYKISLDRTFTVGKPATLMLPFHMGVNAISGGTFYTFGGVEKENDRWVATMNAVTDYIEANTPYLVMPTETSLTFNLGTDLCTEGGGGGQTADEGSNWTFKGTYDYIKWTTDTSDPDYTAERAAEIGRVYGFAGVQKEGIEVGDFVKVASGARIRPMSAYLMWSNTTNRAPARTGMKAATATADELPQSITVRLVGANGQVTGIGEIDTQTGEITFDADSWYTLDGIRLNGKPIQSGIYINNGKQVSIKYGE